MGISRSALGRGGICLAFRTHCLITNLVRLLPSYLFPKLANGLGLLAAYHNLSIGFEVPGIAS